MLSVVFGDTGNGSIPPVAELLRMRKLDSLSTGRDSRWLASTGPRPAVPGEGAHQASFSGAPEIPIDVPKRRKVTHAGMGQNGGHSRGSKRPSPCRQSLRRAYCAGDRLLSLHIYKSRPYAERLAHAANSRCSGDIAYAGYLG